MAVSLLMGRGNDVADVGIVNPDQRVLGSLSLLLDGQAGHDRLAAVATVAAGSTGRLTARVLGGDGNDDLTLAASGWGGVSALLDGGRGFDIGRHTRNVLAVNIEEEVLLD